jgi:A1 cistron-splicing factor AAR2
MSSSLDIDQDLARRLLVEGATLVFLNVPRGTVFGVDMKSWNTGEKFKGVKMIPPGLHYIYYK